MRLASLAPYLVSLRGTLPCCIALFSQRGYENYTLGDATQQTLREIWTGQAYRDFPQGALVGETADRMRQLRPALEPVAGRTRRRLGKSVDGVAELRSVPSSYCPTVASISAVIARSQIGVAQPRRGVPSLPAGFNYADIAALDGACRGASLRMTKHLPRGSHEYQAQVCV